jgi:nitroreductase
MKNLSPTIERQLHHRTVREFTDEPVSAETLGILLEVANRTATSTGLQNFSVVRVTDPKLRREIAEVCDQEYVARVTELLIFIVDAYRNARIAIEQDYEGGALRDMDRFFSGYTDAAIAAQNLTCAAESLGMGAVYFGSILNDQDAIIDLLDLPEYTFPVVGVGFGWPNQEPQLKPRMPLALKVFENKYDVRESYLDAVSDYDREMREYYDTRAAGRRSDSFSEQVVKRFRGTLPKRAKMLAAVRRQGFDLGLD